MAAGDVGRQAVYHDQYGDHVGWIAEYQAGRDAGDHFVSGWTNTSAQDGGTGPYFATWSVYRETGESGTFSFYGVPVVPPDTGETPGEPGEPSAPGHPSHPIFYPDLKPTHPIVIPEPPTEGAPGVPTHPIYYPPYVDIGFPGPQPHPEHPIYWPEHPEHPIVIPPDFAHPSHPIYYPDLKPTHPIVIPPNSLPGFDLSDAPEHAELPNLNHGFWAWIAVKGVGNLQWGFVTSPLGIEQPTAPVEPTEGVPGSWVVTVVGVLATWAWIPDDAQTYPPAGSKRGSARK